MPRIRTIKPNFFANEELGKLKCEARLLFIGLWTLADREGRLEDRPVRIGAQLFPYDSWHVASLLEDLNQARLISRYEAEGKKCIQIINFLKHQSPHPKETNFGLPPCREITGNSVEVTGNNRDSHVLTHGSMDHGLTLSPTPLPAEEGGTSSPGETKGARKTSERESKSRFSLKECEQYAASLKRIKSPKAYGKTIWRSGEDDDAVGEFLGHTGEPMKKPPDKPVDVAEMQRFADELERMDLKGAAAALRAGLEGK